ncbi:MAG TPA: YciI family protein [Actinomycetota bacterium]|jgi:hypothetical protein
MKYALLIYGDEKAREAAPPEATQMMYEAYGKFGEELEKRKAFVAGEELEPSTTATSVRIEGGPGGELMVTDGPFVETKEQLGGFYIVECQNLDEAIELAAKVPSAPFGTIEVRPVAVGPRAH